jgi:hypothetical protein
MTAQQATDRLKYRYPKLESENLVLWATVLNLFEAIEETNRKCAPTMTATIHPTRVRPFSEHGENIKL